jgi:alkylation response protein AidB-like acyl-CoA dehydrogenase
MVDAHNAARIEFDNVEVDADSVLGEVDPAARCWKSAQYRPRRGCLRNGRA